MVVLCLSSNSKNKAEDVEEFFTVNKGTEKTKTNNVSLHLSILSDFSVWSTDPRPFFPTKDVNNSWAL